MRKLAIAAALMAGMVGCGGHSDRVADTDADTLHHLPDTLRVATLYSPESYFIYRETRMGYDYELVSRLAADRSMTLDLQVAPSLSAAIEMLDSGFVDLIAYEVPVIAEYREHVVPCGPENITTQVLVQPRAGRDGEERIDDVTRLVGRNVYVERDSKYEARLRNLNDEIGGGINIHTVDRDTLIAEDLIAMVSNGEIPLTIVDSDIARINKTYYNDLDITMQVSFPQRSRWAVGLDKKWLADSIDSWLTGDRPRSQQAALLKRYFEMSKTESSRLPVIDLSRGRISPFDGLFRKYAGEIGWDWRLVAAQGYAESRFDSTLVSWAGAKGVMQIMPSTARAYKAEAQMTSNAVSIATACRIIRDLDKSLAARVPDPEERKKFVVAAYNSGLAHVLDAIALAEKYGLDPRRWDGNVDRAILMKSKPEYYNDPVCRYGYFRGRQTTEYVAQVFDFYNRARSSIKP